MERDRAIYNHHYIYNYPYEAIKDSKNDDYCSFQQFRAKWSSNYAFKALKKQRLLKSMYFDIDASKWTKVKNILLEGLVPFF